MEHQAAQEAQDALDPLAEELAQIAAELLRPGDLQGDVNNLLPLNRDWRGNFVTPVPDQLGLPTCWAWGIAGSFELEVNSRAGPGSEREILTTKFIKEVSIPGVDGLANVRKAYKHLEHHGIENHQIGTRYRADKEMLKMHDYVAPEDPNNLPPVNERELIRLVAARAVCVNLSYGTTFDTLGRGIIYEGLPAGEEVIGEHCVVLVGYDTVGQDDHIWWVRNSWTDQWADDGFGMIRRATGTGRASVFSAVHYPIIDRVERHR